MKQMVIAFVILAGCSKGEWKPTGDGRTVVNTKTGEIKSTTTGLTREEAAEKEREYQERNRIRSERIKRFIDAHVGDITRALEPDTFEAAGLMREIRLGKVLSPGQRDRFVGMLDDVKSKELDRKAKLEAEAQQAGVSLDVYMKSQKLPQFCLGPEWDALWNDLKELN